MPIVIPHANNQNQTRLSSQYCTKISAFVILDTVWYEQGTNHRKQNCACILDKFILTVRFIREMAVHVPPEHVSSQLDTISIPHTASCWPTKAGPNAVQLRCSACSNSYSSGSSFCLVVLHILPTQMTF